jgi:hypothetical protein
MSERCGVETKSGTPCKNDAETCPWHNPQREDVREQLGRPPVITEEDEEDILEAARHGASKEGCARIAGAESAMSLNRYMERNPEFGVRFRKARGRGELSLIKDGLRNSEVDASTVRFLLATSFGHVKAERRELTGKDGEDLSVSSSIVTVDEVDG